MEAEVELAVAGAGEPVADNISGGDLDRGGAGVGGERGCGAETLMSPTRPRILPAVSRRCRTGRSAWCRTARPAVDVGGGRGDAAVQLPDLSDQIDGEAAQGLRGVARPDRAQQSAARSAVELPVRPAGKSRVSTTWSRLTVWVRVLTRSSRCSTIARRAVMAPSTAAEFNLRARQCSDPDRGGVGVVVLRPCPVDSSRTRRRVWPAHRRRRCRRGA